MAVHEVDISDLPRIYAFGPPRDWAPTPGEDEYYAEGIKPHYWALAFLVGLCLWGVMIWALYAALVYGA